MSEQQSQKRGVRSEAQKTARARNAFEPIPPANAVAGAFGEQQKPLPTDEDHSYSADDKHQREEQDSE